MARIPVYDPQSRPGTIEEEDQNGSTFVPDSAGNDIAPVVGSALNMLGFGVPGFITGKAQQLSRQVPPGQFNPMTQTPLGKGLSQLFLTEPRTPLGKASKTMINVAPLIPIGVGAGRAAFGAGKTAVKTGQFLLSPSARMALAGATRKVFEQVGQGAGPALEAELAQIPQTVNIRPTIQKFVDAFRNQDIQRALGQAIAKAASVGDNTLERFLNQPALAEKASALDAHRVAITLEQIPEVQRVVTILRSNLPGKGAKFIQRATPEAIDFLKHSKDIRSEIEGVAGPAFKTAISKFAKTNQDVRKLTPFFSERNLVRNIATGFGGPFGSEISARVARTLPRTTFEDISRIPRGLIGLGILGGTTLGKRFLSPRHIEAAQTLSPP